MGQKDMIVSMETLQNVGPIVTIYGSARLGPQTFEYHRARYTAGLLAKEGYAVMSGGGPGIMEAANRGAWEAKGTSVGVNLHLPNEQHSNGYQTISLQHKDFYTRKEVLGRTDAIVSEKGGFGTQDEVLGQLTQIQTGKVRSVPVVLVGSDYHGRLESFFRKSLLADGTISRKDLNLYKIVNDPREIVAQLRKQKTSPAIGSELSGTVASKSEEMNGVFVQLNNALSGRLHVSKMQGATRAEREGYFNRLKEGDKIPVMVTGIEQKPDRVNYSLSQRVSESRR